MFISVGSKVKINWSNFDTFAGESINQEIRELDLKNNHIHTVRKIGFGDCDKSGVYDKDRKLIYLDECDYYLYEHELILIS